MPTIPNSVKLTKTSIDILNAIRNSASANYKDYVPEARPDKSSLNEIGSIIMSNPVLQNEFLSALINRIGRVIITSKAYSNPWTVFKKGILEFGETVEEIFVNIAKPYQYDPAVAESKVFARENPDVRSAFHPLNYKTFYKTTILQNQLKQAFLSLDGITDFITKIVNSMYAGANYDEFQVMKYLIALHILKGHLNPVDIPDVNKNNASEIASIIKGKSNDFEFMSTDYNLTGVQNYVEKPSQYLIVNSKFDAIMDVNVLATAFNMDKADFMGHRILVDSFGKLDTERLNDLFSGNPDYTPITDEELKALDTIPAILIDKDWFMIFDNLFEFTEQYNGQGLYWNYWYHVWKIFSISPFANASVFVSGVPTVKSVTVSPTAITSTTGQNVVLSAKVETENFAPQSVKWEIVESVDGVYIDNFGVVTIDNDVANDTVITVKATSTFDTTKSDTATITVSNVVTG